MLSDPDPFGIIMMSMWSISCENSTWNTGIPSPLLVWRFSRPIGETMLDRIGVSTVARSTPRRSASSMRAPSTTTPRPIVIQKIGMPVSWQTRVCVRSETSIALRIV